MTKGNRVFAVDFGAGFHKYKFIKDDGEVIMAKKPSLIARAPMEAKDMPLYNGQRFYLGEAALLANQDDVLDMSDYLKIEEGAPVFLKDIMDSLGIDSVDDVDLLVIGLSIAHMKHLARFMKKISKFKIDNKQYDFTGKIIIVPQGICIKYHIDTLPSKKEGTYLIIDGGFLTADIANVIADTIRIESAVAHEGKGVITVARNIQQYVSKKFGDPIHLKEADKIIQDRTHFVDGEYKDLGKVIDDFAVDYGAELIRFAKETEGQAFKKYKKIYIAGGLGYFMEGVDLPKNVEILENPEFANVEGFFNRGLIELKNRKALKEKEAEDK